MEVKPEGVVIRGRALLEQWRSTQQSSVLLVAKKVETGRLRFSIRSKVCVVFMSGPRMVRCDTREMVGGRWPNPAHV